jgi:carnitine-CoA ligase
VTPDLARESLAELVERQARAYGRRACLSFGDGTTLRYGELAEQVARTRGVLGARGIGPGDRVALMMRNSLFFPTAWLGVTTWGATAVPVNARYGSEDAGYVIEHSGVSLVVCDTSTEPVVRDLAERLGLAALAVGAGEHRPEVVKATDPVPPGPCTGETLANIQYTSGTTGFPKGCLLTHGFWQRMGR